MTEALGNLCEVFARSGELYLDDAEGEAGVRRVAGELSVELDRTLGLLVQLEPSEPLADLSFAGGLELRRALRALGVTQKEELQIAVETARRKLRRVVRVLLQTAGSSGLCSTPASVDGDEELRTALEVRRMYAVFRRGLRRPSSEAPEAVLEAVRYAVGAIAQLGASPSYREMRAQDRHVLAGLRQRALEWARVDKSSRAGLRLLGDIWACADLLRSINRRQELRQHDEVLVKSLAPGPSGNPEEWWRQLNRLDGLDDALDILLDRARATPASPPLQEICARLDYLVEPPSSEPPPEMM